MRYLILLICFFVMACNAKSKFREPENALDAGRGFIGHCLQGDFVSAKDYMLSEKTNDSCLIEIEKKYRKNDRDERQKFRQASIVINQIEDIDSSTTIINYSYSFDKTGHKVKIIKTNAGWRVDFKYTFNPNL